MTQAITPELLHEEDPLTPESVVAALVSLNECVATLLEADVNPSTITATIKMELESLMNKVNELIRDEHDNQRVYYRTNQLNELMLQTRQALVGVESHQPTESIQHSMLQIFDFYKEMYSILIGNEETQPLEPITDEQLTQD